MKIECCAENEPIESRLWRWETSVGWHCCIGCIQLDN